MGDGDGRDHESYPGAALELLANRHQSEAEQVFPTPLRRNPCMLVVLLQTKIFTLVRV